MAVIDYGNGKYADPVVLVDAAGNPSYSAGGTLRPITATITRLANVTPYVAGDVINALVPAVITLAAAATSAGGSGTFKSFRVVTSNKLDASRYQLHVYRATFTAVTDNLPMPFLVANAANFIGTIQTDLGQSGTDTTNSTGSWSVSRGEELGFTCAALDTALYAQLVILDDAVPISGQTYALELLAA
jgi:hypothetical protein